MNSDIEGCQKEKILFSLPLYPSLSVTLPTLPCAKVQRHLPIQTVPYSSQFSFRGGQTVLLVFFNPHHIYVSLSTLWLASVFFKSSIYCLQKCRGDLKTQELTGGCIREGVLVLPQDEDTEILLEDLNTIQGRIKVLQEQVEAGRKKLQVRSCSSKNVSTHVYVIDDRALKAH